MSLRSTTIFSIESILASDEDRRKESLAYARVRREESFVSSSIDEAQVDLVRRRLRFNQEDISPEPAPKQMRREEDELRTSYSEQPSSTSLLDTDASWKSPAPTSKAKFPVWTQKQVGCSGRRPYSRSCVTILSWWYKHLPYLSTPEMEVVANLSNLSKHQVKVWWQNRRHSQRARAADTVGQLTALLPCIPFQSLPNPHSRDREGLFEYLLQFYFLQVAPTIQYSQTTAFMNFLS